MRSPQTIIKRPLLTEKSTTMRETGGAAAAPAEGEEYAQKIVLEVARNANKIEIRKAVESLWKVKVADVHTMVVRGKFKRLGRHMGQRPSIKKAIITLQAGESIEFFEGV